MKDKLREARAQAEEAVSDRVTILYDHTGPKYNHIKIEVGT